MTHHFWYIRFANILWPWNPGQWSLKVIGIDTGRSATYDFLLKWHDHGPISYRFWDILGPASANCPCVISTSTVSTEDCVDKPCSVSADVSTACTGVICTSVSSTTDCVGVFGLSLSTSPLIVPVSSQVLLPQLSTVLVNLIQFQLSPLSGLAPVSSVLLSPPPRTASVCLVNLCQHLHWLCLCHLKFYCLN